jgi:Domain of unknown function (DUF5916)
MAHPRVSRCFHYIAGLSWAGLGHAAAQAPDLFKAPHTAPAVEARVLSAAPVLDGDVLGDSAWQAAARIDGFWQNKPSEGRPATQRTEVFLGYSSDSLYIGVVCYDDSPAGIIIADSRRDSPLEDSDSFLVLLDTFRDRQNGFIFGTNPAGIEYDGQVAKEGVNDFGDSSGGFNLNWDTSWSVKARVSEIGWSAEMRIPFKSLRYGGGAVQTWGINFQRSIRRNNEVAFWSPVPRQHNLHRVSQAGVLEALAPPKQRSLLLTPYALGRIEQGGALPPGRHQDEDFGFDLKYSVTPSLTLDATYNTDFAQVEVDDLQVSLDRFDLFFPEKRPFFLENADQFTLGTPEEVELFFSRRIGVGPGGVPLPIEGGLRLSGKVGDSTHIGLLQMRSEAVAGVAPQNDYSVARINQELPNRSSLGAIFVQRDGDGSANGDERSDLNRVFGVDGRWGIGERGLIRGYLARSQTPGLSADDHAASLIASYQSAGWSNSIGYTEVGANFNPEVGFLERRDYRKAELSSMLRHRPLDLWGLQEVRPHINYRGYWDPQGYYETGFVHMDSHWEWRSGMEIHTGANLTHEGIREPFEIVDGVFVPPGEYDHAEAQLVFMTNQGAPLSLKVEGRSGGFFGGERQVFEPTLRYRIGATFTSELSWIRNDVDLPVPDGEFTVDVGRLRLSYSFSPKILLQALVQYDDRDNLLATNLRLSWLQSANTGLYLVYNEVESDLLGPAVKPRRELILKYSRIFDLWR